MSGTKATAVAAETCHGGRDPLPASATLLVAHAPHHQDIEDTRCLSFDGVDEI